MELGGKSPVLIFEDADIERALDAALFTIFSINGERCTAGSRIFIQESIYPEFVKRFAERANRLRVGDPQDPNTQVGALISPQHWEKVSGYIRLGVEEGATLLAGGPDKPAGLSHGNFLRPTVLADVDNRMRVAQEEIFGPVACLLPFKSEEDGLRMANDVEYGLASYIWTQDVSKVLRLARGIEAGMVSSTPKRARSAPTVRRRESLWHRPRRRGIQLRSVRRNEERVHFHGRPPDPEMGRLSLRPQ